MAGRGGSFPGGCALDNARQRDAADVQRQVVNLGGAGVVGGCLRPVKFPSQQLPAFRGSTAPGQRELCGIVGLRGAVAFLYPGQHPAAGPLQHWVTLAVQSLHIYEQVPRLHLLADGHGTKTAFGFNGGDLPRRCCVQCGLGRRGFYGLVLGLGTFHKQAATGEI